MKKIKIVSGGNIEDVEKEVNNFCSDKKNFEIQHSVVMKYYEPYGSYEKHYTIIIIYEE